MFNLILVRYGEIALKSGYVRNTFENILMQNIRSGLKSVGLEYKIKKDFGRIYIQGYSKKAGNVLKRVFGIVSFSPALEVETDLGKIKRESVKAAKKYIKKSDSFAVDCNRAGKHAFTSQEAEKAVGSEIVKTIRAKVNLSDPDKTIGIDVRQDKTYIFAEKIRGVGGIPLGSQGKVVSLIENMDGVMASWMFMKRGCFIAPVFIGGGKKYLKIMENWHIGHEMKHYFLKKYSPKQIEKIAKGEMVPAIVTGDHLGNIKKINYTVFRPLIGMPEAYIEKIKTVINQ